MNKTLNKDNSKLPRRTDTAGCRSSLKDGSTIYKEEAKRNRKNAWMAYVAAFHLRFAPAAPPWRPRVRGMRQDCAFGRALDTTLKVQQTPRSWKFGG